MNQLLTETVLFYWDRLDLSNQAAENNIVGVDEIKLRIGWASLLHQNSFLRRPLNVHLPQTPVMQGLYPAVVLTRSLIQDSQATPVSAGTRAGTPTHNLASESQECGPYIQGRDQRERQALPNPSSKHIAKFVSDSERGEWVSPPFIGIQTDTKKADAKGSKGKNSKKRTQQKRSGKLSNSSTPTTFVLTNSYHSATKKTLSQ
ncbi:hypothetical protein OG21DRAFT_1496599, partial [Imleria badia]